MTLQTPAYKLAHKLAVLPEPGMREAVLIEYLRTKPISQSVEILNEIYTLGLQGGPPYHVAMLAITAVLSREQLEYPLLTELYNEIKQRGFDTLGHIFFSRPGRQFSEDEYEVDDQEQTLGHRKWFARAADREVIERLLCNPEPPVIEILLKNPMLCERDVIQLASRRPANAEIQQLIVLSSKWVARYRVKRALVLNPYTPINLSIRLLSLIKKQDLRLIQSSPSLPEALREAAAQLLAKV